MQYSIICKNPFIFICNENEEILKSDYDFIVENPEECGIPQDIVAVEYASLAPSEFSKVLDNEVKSGFIYTFEQGNLVKRFYRKAPYFYLKPEDGIPYPTYCVNANSIKSGLLTNKELLAVLSGLLEGYCLEGFSDVNIDVPIEDGEVLAYLCIPVIQKAIPIGRETEEEHQEELEDQGDF